MHVKGRKEIKGLDHEGNVWRIIMYPITSKSNRFQLSFCFNEKEFELSKIQSVRSAEDMWDLLSRIKKGKSEERSVKPHFEIDPLPSKNIEPVYQQEGIHEQQQVINKCES